MGWADITLNYENLIDVLVSLFSKYSIFINSANLNKDL